MSVDRNAKGRIKASYVPSFFNNITNKITVDSPQKVADSLDTRTVDLEKRKETEVNLQD